MDRPTRLITLQDAAVLADLLSANRKFLAPWEPVRADEYFTADGQREVIRGILQEHSQGMCLPHVILNRAGEVAGRITLNSIVRGAFQSCSMGYWVDAGHNGRGLATAAVRSPPHVPPQHRNKNTAPGSKPAVPLPGLAGFLRSASRWRV